MALHLDSSKDVGNPIASKCTIENIPRNKHISWCKNKQHHLQELIDYKMSAQKYRPDIL